MRSWYLFPCASLLATGLVFAASCGSNATGSTRESAISAAHSAPSNLGSQQEVAPQRPLVVSENDSPPARELIELYNQDPSFRRVLDDTFANLPPGPDGAPNYWQGKSVHELRDFVNAWYSFLPTTSDGLEYIDKFMYLFVGSEHGRRFVLEEPGRSWTKHLAESRAAYMDSPASREKLQVWLDDPSIRIDDYVVPKGGYQSFNEFFTRELKPGKRPVTDPEDDSVVASPADCWVSEFETDLTLDTPIETKGNEAVNVRRMLNGSQYAKHFAGGSLLRCILLPNYYHHYHAPVSGTLVESMENVPGAYFNERILSSIEHYHRGYFVFKTERFGYVAMIPVGLATISSVEFEAPYRRVENGTITVAKGTKLGHFAYGGSMVILLFEKDRLPRTSVHQGQRIGELENPDRAPQ